MTAAGPRANLRESPARDGRALPSRPGTWLVLKSERRTRDPLTGQEFSAESIYRDHKLFDGVFWPTRRIDRRDGKDLEDNAGL